MATLFVLFNLKPGVERHVYEAWARTTDVPIVSALRSVNAFRVYRASGLLGGGDSPYQYVETIEVNDLALLGDEIGSAEMQRVAGQFQQFADNPIFIVGDRFAPS